jgi:hypothetical protein
MLVKYDINAKGGFVSWQITVAVAAAMLQSWRYW